MAYHAPNLKRLPLTQATVTPPSLNRQHSYNSRTSSASSNASAALSSIRTRSLSPQGTASSSSPLSRTTSSPVSLTSGSPGMERRTSWEDCTRQRGGYVSFPDLDEVCARVQGGGGAVG
ncbi:hypothetical protein LTR62_008596 [Meristemomyces frigidus]|uniref:Uncharacterized protein n=1 Tax=Meristemomyces frigidus TaxID=1508187 RepID=A0AAN7TDD9_9PEZI|nr:hypothetical protein LTR62_008596 [Meristemomyces frigidus]